jgi:hypothetical protein
MKLLKKINEKIRRFYIIPSRIDAIQEALGRIEAHLNAVDVAGDPRDYEFKVYSQWGEDGIIDHLVNHVAIKNKIFVEFGVENYSEANTIFLLKHRQWGGLVIDGSSDNIDSIRQGNIFWRYDLSADCSFITKENINLIIKRNGIAGDIGLLSVDIDGNDYWVWDAIDIVQPRIVVAEYNSLFGVTATISTPYQANFYRTDAHQSNMYYGASISALNYLATKRGYTLVAGNSAGNNVFFVRNDVLGTLKPQSVEEAYVSAAFREARSVGGAVELLDFSSRQEAIGHLPVVDVVTGDQKSLKEAL